jgi:hypothetical protein
MYKITLLFVLFVSSILYAQQKSTLVVSLEYQPGTFKVLSSESVFKKYYNANSNVVVAIYSAKSKNDGVDFYRNTNDYFSGTVKTISNTMRSEAHERRERSKEPFIAHSPNESCREYIFKSALNTVFDGLFR